MKSFGHHEDYALLSCLRRGENRSAWTKTSYLRERTNNKLNLHMARIQTQATLVGGKCSQHCATCALPAR